MAGTSSTVPRACPLAFVRGEGDFVDYDLEGFVLRSADPRGSARALVDMGFASGDDEGTVQAGGYGIRLVPAGVADPGQSMLYHIGCLVQSAEDHRREAEEQGLEIQNFVEGPNTVAVFVRGPEGVSVEYVEHKPTFSLT